VFPKIIISIIVIIIMVIAMTIIITIRTATIKTKENISLVV